VTVANPCISLRFSGVFLGEIWTRDPILAKLVTERDIGVNTCVELHHSACNSTVGRRRFTFNSAYIYSPTQTSGGYRVLEPCTGHWPTHGPNPTQWFQNLGWRRASWSGVYSKSSSLVRRSIADPTEQLRRVLNNRAYQLLLNVRKTTSDLPCTCNTTIDTLHHSSLITVSVIR